MANFPSTIPPVVQEHIDYIRFWLGNLPTSAMSDADMTVFIEMNITTYGDDNCKIAYYSTLDALYWLLREEAKGQGSSGGGGAGTYVSKVQEKVGKREITKEWRTDSSGTSTTATGWQSIIDQLIKDPTLIGCNPIPSTGASTQGLAKVYNTKNRFDTASPWRETKYPKQKTWVGVFK